MKLFLAYHLGLGDAIICAGLVNYLSKEKQVVIPFRQKNMASVKSFYAGNENVEFISCDSDREVERLSQTHDAIYKLGQFHTNDPTTGFPRMFYDQCGVDWKERWLSSPIYEYGRQFEDKLDKEERIFVHDDSSRGYIIHVDGVRPEKKADSILEYCHYIMNCTEIHCIDSSFLHLIESLPLPKKPKLFYHRSARPESVDYGNCLKHPWKIC